MNTQLPKKPWLAGPIQPLVVGKLRRGLVVKACCAAPSTPDSVEGQSVTLLERCFVAAPSSEAREFGPVMKGQYGAFGAVTLEKGKLDMTQKQSKSSPEVSLTLTLISLLS
jgi:hypothetical protein